MGSRKLLPFVASDFIRADLKHNDFFTVRLFTLTSSTSSLNKTDWLSD